MAAPISAQTREAAVPLSAGSSSYERGPVSDKGAASERRSEKSETKGTSNQRAQSSDKDKSERGAAKETDTSKSNRAEKESAKNDREAKDNRESKEGKGSSSGAAAGETGKATTESRGETSTRGHVPLSSEQRTKVQGAFKGHLTSTKADVNIDVRVGVAIPRDFTLVDIPEDVVVIVPEWRRYKYVLIGDEICIVDPDTYEIVEVIAAVWPTGDRPGQAGPFFSSCSLL